MRFPLISVITITFNRSNFLGEAIQSVLDQTYNDFEYIIVDDGSNDDTHKLIESFNDARIKYFYLEHSGHVAKLRNFGIKNTLGEWICFLDSDDIWKKEKLEKQIDLLNENPNSGFAFCNAEVFDKQSIIKNTIYSEKLHFHTNSIVLSYLTNKFVIYPSTLIFQKSCLSVTGRLDESLLAGEHDFILRLSAHFQCSIARAPLVRIRKHEENFSDQIAVENSKEALFTIQKFFDLGNLSKKDYWNLMFRHHKQLAEAWYEKAIYRSSEYELRVCLKIKPYHIKTLLRWLLIWLKINLINFVRLFRNQ